MDENSCEGETSGKEKKSVDKKSVQIEKVTDFILARNSSVGVKLEKNEDQVLNRSGSSLDHTGPSLNSTPSTYEDRSQESECDRESPVVSTPVMSTPPPLARLSPEFRGQHTTARRSIGPPPSYSFVMKQKKKGQQPSRSDILTSRSPPPTYAGVRGVYNSPSDDIDEACIICELALCRVLDFYSSLVRQILQKGCLSSRLRKCDFHASFSEPVWRSHPQPAFCPCCGILVITTTHAHESVATHVAALALCLFGCWPCCFLPYCMNACKNTYHHCPICQAYLGVYTPW